MTAFTISPFPLVNGGVFPEVTLAFRTYGTLSADRDNAILVTHGLTSSHLAAEPPTLDRRIGWGAGQIGPGLLYDTDRYFVISSNVLGSAYGSTSAASVNPATGRPWGRDFPFVAMEDVVRAQERLVRSFGIERLKAVAGCSLGGFQAYQWAVTFPDRMDRIIATDTAAHDSFGLAAAIPALIDRFSRNPAWHDGEPAAGACVDDLAAIREEMLVGFGIREKLALTQTDPLVRAQMLRAEALDWARVFEPWVLISMYRTAASFDVRDRLGDIRAPVLMVMADTDEWYPPAVGRALQARLLDCGVAVTYHEIASRLGHYATTEEPEKWVPQARVFLDAAPAPPRPLSGTS
jgi:homoserine O-acetyltransferase